MLKVSSSSSSMEYRSNRSINDTNKSTTSSSSSQDGDDEASLCQRAFLMANTCIRDINKFISIEIDQSDQDFFYIIDKVYSRVENEAALSLFERALELDPENAEAEYGKGVALSHLGQYTQAIEMFCKALENARAAPIVKDIYTSMGYAYLLLDQLEDAYECVERALSIDPSYIEALKNKALLLKKLQHLKESIRCLNLILSIDPNYDQIVKFVF